MNNYIQKHIQCPNCSHSINMVVDKNQVSQQVYDDCPSCHRAIEMKMVVNQQTHTINLFIDDCEDGLF